MDNWLDKFKNNNYSYQSLKNNYQINYLFTAL